MPNIFCSAVIFFLSGIPGWDVLKSTTAPDVIAECPEIKVTYSIKKNESALYSIDFELTGGRAPYKLVFYMASGRLISSDFSKTGFSGLDSGEYQLTAFDKNNCRITQKVQLP
jgi:hypothetical protein